MFAGVGDTLRLATAPKLSLTLSGPEAAALVAEPDNLVLRAARLLAEAAGINTGAALALEKVLPVASGIGGGSADAAAALRGLVRLWNIAGVDLATLAGRLGADVPVCLASHPARMQGVGERLSAAPRLPGFGLVLANPRLAVATPSVFRARASVFSHPAREAGPIADAVALADWLRPLGNDLEAAAIGLCPPIADVLAAIAAQPGCLLARMSGSGATCFGIFPSGALAARASAALPAAWWRWGGPSVPL